MNKQIQKLPAELIHSILEYANIVNRNGMYMKRINKTDIRYNLLEMITKPVCKNNNDLNTDYNIEMGIQYYTIRLKKCTIMYRFKLPNKNDSDIVFSNQYRFNNGVSYFSNDQTCSFHFFTYFQYFQ